MYNATKLLSNILRRCFSASRERVPSQVGGGGGGEWGGGMDRGGETPPPALGH
eukprot:COSAG06_NODE_5431_length_3485_cov_2.425281_4_plen_52_part_01